MQRRAYQGKASPWRVGHVSDIRNRTENVAVILRLRKEIGNQNPRCPNNLVYNITQNMVCQTILSVRVHFLLGASAGARHFCSQFKTQNDCLSKPPHVSKRLKCLAPRAPKRKGKIRPAHTVYEVKTNIWR